MKINQLKNSLILLTTAIIWGVAFVAQSEGMQYVGPFTFVFTRFIIAGFALLIVILFLRRSRKNFKAEPVNKKALLMGGVCCGFCLGTASIFQQIGIQYTTVGKAGFITALYIVIVPILSIALGKKTSPLVWISVLLATAGLYFLCLNEGFSIEQGDLFVICCAVIFSLHILVVDYFSPKVDNILLSCAQFFVIGLIAAIPMIIFEKPALNDIVSAWQPILYAGLLSSAVGYTFQIIGQRDLNPTVASLIMSLESVVSVLAGLVLLGQHLSHRELLGCFLMGIAIVLAQLPYNPERQKQSN